MATTYFGETTPGILYDTNANTIAFHNKNITYACPGSGSQSLVEISAYVKDINAGASHIRLALYDTSNSLIYQGSAEVGVTSGSYSWVGHTGITGVILTGGTNYRIAYTQDGAVSIAYRVGTSGDAALLLYPDYTGGFPGSIGDGINDDYVKSIRAGVVPVAAVTGTATASITETDIVSGGKTIIITLTGDTWRPA